MAGLLAVAVVGVVFHVLAYGTPDYPVAFGANLVTATWAGFQANAFHRRRQRLIARATRLYLDGIIVRDVQ